MEEENKGLTENVEQNQPVPGNFGESQPMPGNGEEKKSSGVGKGVILGVCITLVILAVAALVVWKVVLPGKNSGNETPVVNDDTTQTTDTETTTTEEPTTTIDTTNNTDTTTNTPTTESNGVVEKSNNFEKKSITNLSVKLAKLNFTPKSSASCSEAPEAVDGFYGTLEIKEGKVEVTVLDRKYTVNVSNPKSVGCNKSVQGSGSFVSYILTRDGEVYRIIDWMSDVRKDSNYKGTVENLNIVKADAIAVPYGESFYLADSAETTNPTVYIKTTDGRYYTDEFSDTLVEVVEK